jgi:DNA-binding LacI/PurR family transcriptional regulator
VIDLVFAGNADGVVLLNAIPLGKADRLLTRSRAPILAMSLPTFDVPQVLVGERDAAAAVVEQLLALRPRRFGYVTRPRRQLFEHEHWAGFRGALAAAGVVVPSDVSRVGFDGIEFADYCAPPLRGCAIRAQ